MSEIGADRLPESMQRDFERQSGVVFAEPSCFLHSPKLREEFVSLLATRVARLVVAMTQGTCGCGKAPSDCCKVAS